MKPGGVSIFVLLVFVVGLIVAMLATLVVPLVVPQRARSFSPEMTMAIAIVLTVAVMMALLFAVAAGFSALGLTNTQHALGLPEGSIRAMIALILIMVFIILDIYMFRIVGQGTDAVAIFDSPAQYQDLADSDRIIDVNLVPGPNNTTNHIVTYRYPVSEEGTTLAQQVVTTVGTLVVAVAGFYFGSTAVTGGVTAAAAAASATSRLGPVIVGFTPQSGKQNQTITMKIEGRRLRGCRSIRLVRGDEVMTHTGDVTSSDAQATCSMVLNGNPEGGKWDLVVENENGQRDVLPQAFELMP